MQSNRIRIAVVTTALPAIASSIFGIFNVYASLTSTIRARRIFLFGHIARMDDTADPYGWRIAGDLIARGALEI